MKWYNVNRGYYETAPHEISRTPGGRFTKGAKWLSGAISVR